MRARGLDSARVDELLAARVAELLGEEAGAGPTDEGAAARAARLRELFSG